MQAIQLATLVTLCGLFDVVVSARILFIPMHILNSHKKSMMPLAEALAKRGHDVTMWKPFFTNQSIGSKYVKEIDIIVDTNDTAYRDRFIYGNDTGSFDSWTWPHSKPWDYDLHDKMHAMQLASLVTLFVLIDAAVSARILFIPMHILNSHKKSMMPLAEALAKLGHEVTMWNAFFTNQSIGSKYVKEIDIIVDTNETAYRDQFIYGNDTGSFDSWTWPHSKPWDYYMIWLVSIDICRCVAEQRFDAIKSITRQKWDLVIIDQVGAPCGFPVAEMSGSPYIIMSTTFMNPASGRHLGHSTPVSSASYIREDYDPLLFKDRLRLTLFWNVLDILFDSMLGWAMRTDLAPPLSNRFDYPTFESNAMLTISPYPPSLQLPRPDVPDTLYVGDRPCSKMHKSVPSLPEPFERFVSDPASKGTIVASFGHCLSWVNTPNSTIYIFYQAFRQMSDYRFVLQYNGPRLPPLPNLIMSEWVHQKALLFHARTKGFFSHTGLKSLIEGICAKVPFIALPMFAEQTFNTQNLIERHHLGTRLDKRDLSVRRMIDAIRRAVEDDRVKQRVVEAATLMEDKIVDQDDLEVFWIEFVIRRHSHMRILQHRGRLMTTWTRHSMDIVSAFVGLVLSIGYLAAKLTYTCSNKGSS